MLTTATGTFFGNQCADQGMLVRVSGDTIMMSPPLISTKDEIKEVFKATFYINFVKPLYAL